MQYEDYCSFETSKLLKECGYPQSKFGVFYVEKTCTREYDKDYDGDMPIVGEINYKEGEIISINNTFGRNYEANPPRCVRPTLYQAMKWLREEKNIWIHIKKNSHNLDWRSCPYIFYKNDSVECANYPIADYRYARTYEEAEEAGIVAALNYVKDKPYD